jgi:CheY-like chemotaxis protein
MSVPHVLLRLLLEGPAHGYDLRRKLAAYRAFYPLNNVNVYPALKGLEEDGWVCSRSEISQSRVRKVYEITEVGVSEFERWIGTPPAGSLAAETDPLALKLAMASSRRGTGLEWLAQCLSELDVAIASWRTSLESLEQDHPRLALLTAQYRLLSLEHRRAYLTDAMKLADEEVGERPPRILLADDSAASRAMSNHLLAAAGYEVRVVEDGTHAWNLLQSEYYDLVVLDAVMPGPTGLELLQRIRANPDLAEIPVILNTVLGEPDQRGAALDAGATAYVCKTHEDAGRQLVQCVDELIGKAAAGAAG